MFIIFTVMIVSWVKLVNLHTLSVINVFSFSSTKLIKKIF